LRTTSSSSLLNQNKKHYNAVNPPNCLVGHSGIRISTGRSRSTPDE